MGGLPIIGGGIGAVVITLLALLFRGTPGDVSQNLGPKQPPAGPAAEAGADDPGKIFVEKVLYETEQTWGTIFREDLHRQYQDPKLVLFDNPIPSRCGMAQSAMGPFYCPLDETVYIDLNFFRELQDRFQAPGDFARAYVIAHEVGHHVQNLVGIAEQVQNARERSDRTESNALSVAQELQADCYAGVWANRANAMHGVLESGDVEEGLNAASAIGDDKLQMETRGYIVPDSFTHGSSAQRVRWFKAGLRSGRMQDCDTFNSAQ